MAHASVFRLAGGRAAASAARQEVRRSLAGRVSTEALDRAQLLTSELVTNSVRHAGAGEGDSIELRVELNGEVVRVEVADRGPGIAAEKLHGRGPEGDADGGWGLLLVDSLAADWGFTREDRSRVWFELADAAF